MTRSLLIAKEKVSLLRALTRLVQMITLILIIYAVQAGIGVLLAILHILLRIHQPVGIV